MTTCDAHRHVPRSRRIDSLTRGDLRRKPRARTTVFFNSRHTACSSPPDLAGRLVSSPLPKRSVRRPPGPRRPRRPTPSLIARGAPLARGRSARTPTDRRPACLRLASLPLPPAVALSPPALAL
eukprot:6813223-Prymnesium_polylepis.1